METTPGAGLGHCLRVPSGGHPQQQVQSRYFPADGDLRQVTSERAAYDGLTAAARHRTAVIPLPKPFGRSRCLDIDEFSGWFGSVAGGRTVSLYACVIPRPARYALLAANAAGMISRLPRKAIAANPPNSCASRQCCSAHGPTPATRSTEMWVMYPGGGLSIGGKRTSGPR